MGNLDVKSAALLLCIAFTLTFLLSMAVDGILSLTGQTTISQCVWKAPLLGIPVMLPVVVAAISLAVHLFYR